jgi:hypothetical protein
VPGARQNLNRPQKGIVVQAVTVRDRAAGAAGLAVSDIPYPHAAENDVIVRVYAAGFTPGELAWPGTWTDRAGVGWLGAMLLVFGPRRLPTPLSAE